MSDQFFGAQPDPKAALAQKIKNWDGKPVVRMTWDEAREVYSYVPHYSAIVVGPKLPWVNQRALISIDRLVVPSHEEAVKACMDRAHEACVQEGLPWDEDDWTIMQLFLVGGN